MLELNRRLAEAFMREHAGVAVRVSGGGTGIGVTELVENRVDLCAASRPFTPEEVSELHARFETLGLRFLIARDALSVYLHPTNPIRDLSFDQLAMIFAGKVTRWSEVGGNDLPIEVVVRPPNSGTYRFFKDHVLKGQEYAAGATSAARTNDVVDLVAARPGAIGYGGLVYGQDLVHCRLGGIDPSPESVRNGSYPLARYLYFYATQPPAGRNKEFLDWCVSPAGQEVVADIGFVPLWIGD
jgi:phosphate transport system substrate-binding protein